MKVLPAVNSFPAETIDRRASKRWTLIVGSGVLCLLTVMGMLATYVAPYDPYHNNLSESLQGPGREHWLGTDVLGRDILSRLIHGSRTALVIAVVSAGTAGLAGGVLGLIAGYVGGLTSALIMRIMDGLMCFPLLVLALFISMVLGGGVGSVIVALSVGSVALYTRLMIGLVWSTREMDYVTAARSIGSSRVRILVHHILPNALPSLIVQMGLHLGSIILAEASLSFLGIGVRPPTASWGSMVAEGYAYLGTNPAVALAPGIVLTIVVCAFNMTGDALRDLLDPRSRA